MSNKRRITLGVVSGLIALVGFVPSAGVASGGAHTLANNGGGNSWCC